MQQKIKLPADDRYVRATFSNTERAAGLLREFLPSALIECLDLGRLRRLPEQHIDHRLREMRDDLNMECPVLPSGRALVRVLVEHKSNHDSGLWLQLMRSILATWEHEGFAAVIPVVIHTGPDHFRFDTPHTLLQAHPQALLDYQPRLAVCPIDLASCTATRIWQSPYLDPVSQATLAILKLAQQKNLKVGSILETLEQFAPQMSSARRRRILEIAFVYLHYKSKLSLADVSAIGTRMHLVHPINPESIVGKYLAEKLAEGEALAIERGMEKGIEKGIEKGMEMGMEMGMEKGILRGIAKDQLAIVERMLAAEMPWEQITRFTGVTATQLPTLRAQVQS